MNMPKRSVAAILGQKRRRSIRPIAGSGDRPGRDKDYDHEGTKHTQDFTQTTLAGQSLQAPLEQSDVKIRP
jgi:hypothetical protein